MGALERITRIVSQPGHGLLACDVRGGLHWLDRNLNIRVSSPLPATAQAPSGDPVYAVKVVGDWIITRDKAGNICRWDTETLRLSDRLDAASTANTEHLLEGEQPSPTMLRGIGVWQGKAYLNNGYFQVVVLDVESFTVDRISLWPHGYDMLEWFCTDAPGVHAVSDRSGHIHLGSLPDLDFPTVVQVDTSNVHRVVYDERHDRYWAICDAGLGPTRNISNGVVTLGLDGEIDQRMDIARNDVEGLVFSPDFSRAYIGGFDGELVVFDNSTPRLRIEQRIRGFSHQIIDVTVDEDGRIYTLTQDGEVTALSPQGKVLTRLGHPRQCVWDIQPHPAEPGALVVATDDGAFEARMRTSPAGHASLEVTGRHRTGLGFSRRIRAASDDLVGAFWPSRLRRFTTADTTVWEAQLPGIIHTVAVSPDGGRVLAACNAGGYEFDAATGEPTWQVEDLPASAWACAYLDDGRRLLATRNGQLTAYGDQAEPSWYAELNSYPKRLITDGGRVRITGGGGVKEIVVGEDKPTRQFTELLDNTAENCVLIDGVLCVVTYGMQVAAFDYDTAELLDFHEDLPDFGKGMAALHGPDGRAYVVVGGRGGFLRLYLMERTGGGRVLTPLRDLWLPLSDRPVSSAGTTGSAGATGSAGTTGSAGATGAAGATDEEAAVR
ncbi:outer membrane protein assembly factor BamB family protein [Streptomyces malaysiensis]|uniref:outer membrane protein assembly factor BamB family protein n=1 Tax=Streptomyces malaysiensis TaxID=92644 RepID=UPI000853D0AC|nr:PQQ-binding-like beta-propeller repeat protein [Streptomyces sp. SPMA113]